MSDLSPKCAAERPLAVSINEYALWRPLASRGREQTVEISMKLFSFWRSLATYRVRIALNLKGLVPDEVVDVNLMKGAQREAAYRAVNPMMALPAFIDGEGPILFESLAIIEYLDETHPNPPLLPRDARGRARVRGLAQIVACDSHPLIVPRVREYLEHEFKLDEPTRIKWCQHWHTAAVTALEAHLKEAATGRYCHGDAITLADICLASQAAGAKFFSVDTAPFSNFTRIANSLSTIDAFARAHPLKQPGAPAS
jgi:maleylacetoacetate isomerase